MTTLCAGFAAEPSGADANSVALIHNDLAAANVRLDRLDQRIEHSLRRLLLREEV